MKKTIVSVVLAIASSVATAWEPSKPIITLIGNSPGSGNEISFRMVQTELEKKSNVSFVIVNKPGVSELVAANYFATQPADGHTTLVAACNDIYVAPEVWYPTATKFSAMDFVPVATIGKAPLAFWANIDSKVNTPQELIDAMRKNDRKINFALGSPGHRLALEYLIENQKIPHSHVQPIMYKGGGAALLDVMGGHVEFAITPVATGWPNMPSGRLKLIGIAGDKKLAGLEKYPLMKDTVTGLTIGTCWSLLLPPGTPQNVQAWYRDNFVPVLRTKEIQAQFEKNLIQPAPNEHTPEGVKESMTNLRRIWIPVAQRFSPE
jgi:tripartite-type tricarboxylate transporter receptor subunit TctC